MSYKAFIHSFTLVNTLSQSRWIHSPLRKHWALSQKYSLDGTGQYVAIQSHQFTYQFCSWGNDRIQAKLQGEHANFCPDTKPRRDPGLVRQQHNPLCHSDIQHDMNQIGWTCSTCHSLSSFRQFFFAAPECPNVQHVWFGLDHAAVMFPYLISFQVKR